MRVCPKCTNPVPEVAAKCLTCDEPAKEVNEPLSPTIQTLDVVERDMKATLIDEAGVPRELPNGVHPHVVGKWCRSIREARLALLKRMP